MRPASLLAALALAAPLVCYADSLRCGNKLVHEEDTLAQVLNKCGKPTEVEHRTILRRPTIWIKGRPFVIGTDEIEIPVELWTYNFGPHKFMRRLRFEDGRLVAIETLDYGYVKK